MKKFSCASVFLMLTVFISLLLSIPAKSEYAYNYTMEIGDTITVTTSNASTSYVPSGSVFRSYAWSSGNLNVAGIIPNGSHCTIIALNPGTTAVSNKQTMSYQSYDIALKMYRSRAEQGFGDTWNIRVLYPELSLKEVSPQSGAVEQSSDTDIVFTYNTSISEGSAYSAITMTDTQTDETIEIEKNISGSALTIKPSKKLQAGHSYTAIVPANALQNLDGKSLVSASSTTFRVSVAEIAEISPANESINAPIDTPIVIKYDSNIKKGSAWDSISIKNKATDENVPYTAELKNNTITLTPQSSYSYNTLYELTIPAGAIANSQGAETAKTRTFTFTTKPGSLSAVSSSPQNGSENVSVDAALQITFNYPIAAGNKIDGIILRDNTSGLITEGTASVSDSMLTFTPKEQLNYNSKHTLIIPPNSLINNANEPNSYEITVDFTTVSQENETADAPHIEQNNELIKITSVSGTSIYYTEDNTNPVTNGKLYTSPFIPDGNLIRAVAVKSGNISGESVYRASILNIAMLDNFGGSGDDYYNDATACEDGFVAVGRSAENSFGNGSWADTAKKGGNDAVIVKYDDEGNILWKKNLGGSGNDSYSSVTLAEGGYIAVGSGASGSFGNGDWTGATGKGGSDAVIVKYDDNGDILWKKSFGGSGDDSYTSIIAADDGFVAVGYSEEGFGSGDWADTEGKGYIDAIIVKYDNSGTVVWKKNFGGSGYDSYQSVTLAEDGFIAAGYSYSESFGNGDWADEAAKGGFDAIVVKYDKNGDVVWKSSLGGSGSDYFNSVIAAEDGFIAVGNSQADSFENGDWNNVTGKGSSDAIIVKYDNNGNVLWKKNFGGNGPDYFNSVTAADEGFIAAGYSGADSFENGDWSGIKGKGSNDGIIVKYDNEGNVLRKENMGGTAVDEYASVAATRDGVVAAGRAYYRSFGSGDWSDVSAQGEYDAVIVKYNPPVRVEGADKDGRELKELFILGNARVGKQTQYRAAFFPNTAEDKSVVWSVSDESVAAIDENGLLTPLKNGSVTVTVKNTDGAVEKSLDIEISGTKTYINSLNSNIGEFAEDYNATDTERILYVPEGAPSVSLTASYESGSVTSGYGEFLAGIAKEIAIDKLPKTITLTKREAEHDDVSYTILMKKAPEKEPTPDIKIDYENEMLTGFLENGEYTVNGNTVETSWGVISAADYIGTETTVLQIVKKAESEDYLDSEPQQLEIPPRSAAPADIFTVKTSEEGANDGAITNVNSAMEYIDESGGGWIDIVGTQITGLVNGSYEVRYKATETSFASTPAEVSIGVYTYIAELTEDGRAKVFAPKKGTYALIFAMYTPDGTLAEVEIQNITLEAAEEREFEPKTLSITSDNNIKVFLWTELEKLEPLTS